MRYMKEAPEFILRASNVFALPMVDAYRELARSFGLIDHAADMDLVYADMLNWRDQNRDKVKVPSTVEKTIVTNDEIQGAVCPACGSSDRYGWQDCAAAFHKTPDGMRYHNPGNHKTQSLHVEVSAETGQPIAVWFGDQQLPFRVMPDRGKALPENPNALLPTVHGMLLQDFTPGTVVKTNQTNGLAHKD